MNIQEMHALCERLLREGVDPLTPIEGLSHVEPMQIEGESNCQSKLLPCPFCGGEPEEDSGGVSEYYGHEHQDLWVTCKRCGAEVGCYTGTQDAADAPCSCHHDIRKIAYAKWNARTTALGGK